MIHGLNIGEDAVHLRIIQRSLLLIATGLEGLIHRAPTRCPPNRDTARIEQSPFDPSLLRGEEVIVVQTKRSRLGSYLAGQAIFSPRLVESWLPVRRVYSVALCSANDPEIGPLAEAHGVEVWLTSSVFSRTPVAASWLATRRRSPFRPDGSSRARATSSTTLSAGLRRGDKGGSTSLLVRRSRLKAEGPTPRAS